MHGAGKEASVCVGSFQDLTIQVCLNLLPYFEMVLSKKISIEMSKCI